MPAARKDATSAGASSRTWSAMTMPPDELSVDPHEHLRASGSRVVVEAPRSPVGIAVVASLEQPRSTADRDAATVHRPLDSLAE